MSENELSRLADMIVERQVEHPPKCKVFSDADIQGIKDMAKLFASGRSAFFKIIVTLLYIGIGTILLIGFKSWIKDFLGRAL